MLKLGDLLFAATFELTYSLCPPTHCRTALYYAPDDASLKNDVRTLEDRVRKASDQTLAEYTTKNRMGVQCIENSKGI